MILILADEAAMTAAEALAARLLGRGEAVRLVDVSSFSVRACTGCNGCFDVSYGRCVVRDDMDTVLPLFFDADTTVWMTELTWGGVSYAIKKVLDKTAVIGDRFYYVQKGELVKGSQTKNGKWCIFGVKEQPSQAETDALAAYTKENALLLQMRYASTVLSPAPDDDAVERAAEAVLT